MKILKRVFIFVLVLVSIFLISALFIEGKYAVEKQIVIEKPSAEVYEFVKNLKNQEQYSVWQTMDPDMKKSYIGKDGTVGFVASWESNNEKVGKGEQEIIQLTEGKRIDMELRFFEPFKATDNAYMATLAKGPNTTLVKWGFKGEMSYPSNAFMLFMDMEDIVGSDLENGLKNLKKLLEN